MPAPTVYASIQAARTRCSTGKGKKVTSRIALYTDGLCGKLREAEYAFSQIKTLASSPFTSSTGLDATTSEDKLHFYVDSFFAFLYSGFDVMGQVINQTASLSLDEKSVSFKAIKQRVDAGPAGPLQTHLKKIVKSRQFRNLDAYRNCSTHRRRIFIQTTTSTVHQTPGYSSTGTGSVTTKHVLADNPLDLKPKIKKNRELVSYCESALKWAKKELQKAANSL